MSGKFSFTTRSSSRRKSSSGNSH